jgi:hypothetical protein
MSNLATAQSEYYKRPADERFDSLQALIRNATDDKNLSGERTLPWSSLQAVATEHDVRLQSAKGQAKLTHWSFSQLSRIMGAPAGYLRDLPPQLAADCLNHGIAERKAEPTNLLLKVPTIAGGAPTVRSITSDSYSRLWDADLYGAIARTIVDRDASWSLPPVWPGQPIGGAYRGDRDSFLILTNGGSIVADPSLQSRGDAGAMYRGLLVRNSEVGASSITIEQILFRYVCGNHMLWGAVVAQQFRRRHVGRGLTRDTMEEISRIAYRWTHQTTERDTAILQTLISKEVGKDRDASISFLRSLGATQEQAGQAYDLCVEQESQLSPRSFWGLAQGLTRASQLTSYQDERFQLDRIAGQLLAKGARLVAA